MDATRFIDEFRPFRRSELALARRTLGQPRLLPGTEVGALRYALRLAALSTIGSERDDLVEPLATFRLRLRQLLAPVLPTRADEINPRALHEALPYVVALVDRARRDVAERELSTLDALDAELAVKRLVLVLGGAGGCGYVYLGVLQRLAQMGLTPDYMLGCSVGAILAVLRARTRAFELEEVIDEVSLLRAVAVLRNPGRTRFGLPGALRVDLHRALGPLFTRDDGTPQPLGDLAIPVDVLATGIGPGTLGRFAAEYAHTIDAKSRSAREQFGPSGSALTRTVSRVVSLAMSRRVLVPVLLGGDAMTAALPALDAAGFSSAIPIVLQYGLPADDAASAAILEDLFERQRIVGLVDGVLTSAVPARFAWDAVEAGRIGTRNCVIVALHAMEAEQKGVQALLAPIQRVFSATAQPDNPFWDHHVSYHRAPALLELFPREATLRFALEAGQSEFEQTAAELGPLFEPLPPWKQLLSGVAGSSVARRAMREGGEDG